MNIDSVGHLPLHPSLSQQATIGHVLRDLQSASLIAMGPLCDDGCTVILTNKELAAIKKNKVVLRGRRNCKDGLWDIPLRNNTQCMNNYNIPQIHPSMYIPLGQNPRPPESKVRHLQQIKKKTLEKLDNETKRYSVKKINDSVLSTVTHQQKLQDVTKTYKQVPLTPTDKKISVIIQKKQTRVDLVCYLHASCFSPVPSTWIKAIQNINFLTWPALTETLVKTIYR